MRERIHEELDYELEAQNTRAVGRAHRGHPFIVIPEVVTDLCRPHVIVMDFIDGVGHDEVARRDQATRDRVAEIIFRFYFGAMYRDHAFSGDPHPGNSLLLPTAGWRSWTSGSSSGSGGGRRARARDPAAGRRGPRRGHDRADARAPACCADGHAATPESILDQFRRYTRWFTRDEVLELDPGMATRIVLDFSDPTHAPSTRSGARRFPPSTSSAGVWR